MARCSGLLKRTWAPLCGVMLAAVWVAKAHATVVIQAPLHEMTQRSHVVVHATVEETGPVEGEEGRILTLTRLKVIDGIKGAKAGDTVTIYQVGGQLGDRVMQIPGVSEFKPGEEVVFFGVTFLATDTVRFLQTERKAQVPAATLHPSAAWVVPFAIGLGKFQVIRTVDPPMAQEELGDVVTVYRKGNALVAGGRLSRTSQPLDVFLSEVGRMAGRKP